MAIVLDPDKPPPTKSTDPEEVLRAIRRRKKREQEREEPEPTPEQIEKAEEIKETFQERVRQVSIIRTPEERRERFTIYGTPPPIGAYQTDPYGRIGVATPETPGVGAEQAAEIRIREIATGVGGESEEFAQEKYEELMLFKARELGMKYDPETGTYYYRYNWQIEEWEKFSPLAREQAIWEGETRYGELWEIENVEERIKQVYREEYARRGFVLVENKDGTYSLVPEKKYGEYVREQQMPKTEKEWKEWHRSLYKDVDPVTGFVSKYAATVLSGAFSPEFWHRVITKGPESARVPVAKWEYERRYELERGDIGGFVTRGVLLSPAMMNVVYPFLAGAVFGKAFQIVRSASGIATKTGHAILGKTLYGVSKIAPVAIGGTYLIQEGIRIKEGFERDSAKGWIALSETAMRVGFAYMGARWATVPRPAREPRFGTEVLTRVDQSGYIRAVGVTKYMRLFGKRWWYGPKVGREVRPPMFGPKPKWTPWGEPIVPEPSGIAKVPFIGIKPVGPKQVQVSTYLDKVFFDTGKGWQPKTGIPLPGIYKPTQLAIYKGALPTIIPKSGKLILYEPALSFFAKTESIAANIHFLAKGTKWQPKTGIPKPETIEPVKPSKIEDVYKLIFPRKPVRGIKRKPIGVDYKITPSTMEWMGKVWYRDGRGWQPKTGIPLPGVYTDKQLSTLVYPKPMPYWYSIVGKPIVFKFDFGEYFGIKIKPDLSIKGMGKGKQPRVFTVKDLLGDQDKQLDKLYGEGGQIQRGGLKTIQIQKEKQIVEPLIRQKQIPVLEPIVEQKVSYRSYQEMMQQQSRDYTQVQKEADILGFAPMTRQEQRRAKAFASALMFAPEQVSIQLKKLIQPQIQISIQAQPEISLPDYRYIFEFEFPSIKTPISDISIIPKEPRPREDLIKKPPKFKLPKIFDLSLPKEIQEIITPSAYDVYVKKRQYVSGEKVYPTDYERVGKQLSKHDAKSLGAYVVGGTAKRTFKLKKTEGKTKPLRKKVSSWWNVFHQFNQRGENIYVEKTKFCIDSPGEFEEITQKGIEAQRRKGPTLGTDYPKVDKKTSKVFSDTGFVNVNNLIDREIKRLINKSWRI